MRCLWQDAAAQIFLKALQGKTSSIPSLKVKCRVEPKDLDWMAVFWYGLRIPPVFDKADRALLLSVRVLDVHWGEGVSLI